MTKLKTAAGALPGGRAMMGVGLLLALVSALLLATLPGGAAAASATDYDADNDNLIEITKLEQLNALRWDSDGNGAVAKSDQADYDAAFPNAVAGMGCAATCVGYELAASLDFDSDASYADAAANKSGWTTGAGWESIEPFDAILEGNGNTISNLYVNHDLTTIDGLSPIGLFENLLSSAEVRRLGVVDMDFTLGSWVTNIGGITGRNYGKIIESYTTGELLSKASTMGGGGLVGQNDPEGVIEASYSTANVTQDCKCNAKSYIGGLVGTNWGTITASYSAGNVTDKDDYSRVGGLTQNNRGVIEYSYSVSKLTVGEKESWRYGGLVASDYETITDSYWDTEASGVTVSGGGVGKTTSQLQSPTGYTGIYANWNADLNGDGCAEDPWNFGSASAYPTLKAITFTDCKVEGVTTSSNEPGTAAPPGSREASGSSYEGPSNSIAVNWQAKDGVIGYFVAWKLKSAADWKSSGGGEIAVPGASHRIYPLRYDTEYVVRVRAFMVLNGKIVLGAWSDEVEETTGSYGTDAVTQVTATAGPGTLTVTWMGITTLDANGYKVQWKSGSGTWNSGPTVNGLGTTIATITGLTPGTEYTVRVRGKLAVSRGGILPWSAEVTGTPTAVSESGSESKGSDPKKSSD